MSESELDEILKEVRRRSDAENKDKSASSASNSFIISRADKKPQQPKYAEKKGR